MNNPRWLIRKARPIDPWAGTWQVWECTNCPRPGVHREERLMGAYKTHADAVAWLEQHLKRVKHFVHTGEWYMKPTAVLCDTVLEASEGDLP